MHPPWSLFFFLFALATPTPLNRSSLIRRGQPFMRDVWVLMYTYTPGEDAPLEIDPVDGQYYLATHSAILITGNENDGSVFVHIVEDNLHASELDAPEEMQVRTTIDDPLAPGETSKIPDRKTDDYLTRASFQVEGQVSWTNAEIMDFETGNGIIWDSWKGDPVYKQRDNNCHSLVRNILAQANLQVPAPINDIMTEDHKYQQLIADRSPTGQHIDDTIKFEVALGVKRLKGLRQFTIGGGPNNPILSGDDEVLDEPVQEYADTDPNPMGKKINLADKENLDPSICLSRRGLFNRDCTALSAVDDTTQVDKLQAVSGMDSSIIYARTKGILTVVEAFTKEVATAAGVVGAALAPVFILLDLVDGNFKSAAFGLVGAVLGAAAAFGGPIGFAVGAVLSVLFDILPGLFDNPDVSPPSNNNSEIIQFTFFGNKTASGNEACNANLALQGLAQNCSALYGPGVLSSLFSWELYDAVVFLLAFNDGYPMTIPDMAQAFHNIDHTIQGDGGNATATIDCGMQTHEVQRRLVDPGAFEKAVLSSPSLGFDCPNAKYAIKRQLITIPVINQTADLIHDRLIPAPGGDCKILVDGPGGLSLPLYNMTLTGRPAAIACNITQPAINEVANTNGSVPKTATLNQVTLDALAALGTTNISLNAIVGIVNNASIINNASNSQVPGIVSPGNASTNEIAGAGYIEPPAPQPFTNLTATNYACFSSTKGGGSLCLPNGTYASTGTGKHGFIIREATDLALPSGAYINFTTQTYVDQGPYVPPFRYQNVLYSSNVSASSNPQFGTDISSISTTTDSESGARSTFDVIIPAWVPQPPLACLFSAAQYAGDVACFGVGGFNLSTEYQYMAQSVKLYGNASVWLYTQFYGDIGGVPISTDVPDLGALPYSSGNLSGKVVALWIHPGSI